MLEWAYPPLIILKSIKGTCKNLRNLHQDLEIKLKKKKNQRKIQSKDENNMVVSCIDHKLKHTKKNLIKETIEERK